MECSLFIGLTADEKAFADSFMKDVLTFKKSSELYRKKHIGVLIEGKAYIKRCSKANTVTMRTLKPGEIFGAASLFGKWDEGLSNITAETECKICYFPEDDFKRLLTALPQVSLNYIAFLSDRIRFLNQRINAFIAGSTENRLYEYLISQADDNSVVVLDYGMAELARRLKIGRSSLYRGLSNLETCGLIERNNHCFKIK